MNYIFIVLFSFSLLVGNSYSIERRLESMINPGCGDELCTKNITVVHVQAIGPNDTLHYVWDFIDTPSMLLAVTSSQNLHISWENYLMRRNASISFDEKPLYTFGFSINKIIEFNDVNDTGLYNPLDVKNVNIFKTKNFNWTLNSRKQENGFVQLDMEATNYTDTRNNITRKGCIKLTLKGFGSLDHSNSIPNMLHTENSSLIDIILDNFETDKSFSKSRFAFEILLIGHGNPNDSMSPEIVESLNDNYTPGVFELIEMKSSKYANPEEIKSTTTYLQWRPVSYTSKYREISHSTKVVHYPIVKAINRTSIVNNTMLYCYYGNRVEDIFAQNLIVSLGTSKDGFYKESTYLTWTFVLGYGTPPVEKFPPIIIMILAIGLGIPLFILLGGGIYLCSRSILKFRQQGYTRT